MDKLSQFENVTPYTLNKVIDAVNEVSNMSVASPLEINRAGGRINIRLSNQGFLGAVTSRITPSSSSSSSSGSPASNTYTYSIQQVQQDINGQWEYMPGGLLVTAYEWNDSFVLLGTVVWCEPFGVQTDGTGDWRFDHFGDPVTIVTRTTSGQTPPTGYYDAFTSTFNPTTGGLVFNQYVWLKDLNN